MISFSSGQLIQKLEQLVQDSFTGMATVSTYDKGDREKNSSILMFRSGRLLFADSKLPTPQELAIQIGHKYDVSIIDTAVKTVQTKMNNPDSYEKMFAFLARMQIITKEQLEEAIQETILLTLEQISSLEGEITIDVREDLDLTFGRDPDGWSIAEIDKQLQPRSQKWQKLAKAGIGSLKVVPKISPQGTEVIKSITAKKHCQDWIDGKRSLGEIAKQLQKDPLKLATDYYNWVNQGWIYFGESPPRVKPALSTVKNPETSAPSKPNKKMATVLSVDDSPIVQTMLKRSLKDNYEVLLAENGMEALKVLNDKQKIDLVLLDVTMPDVDGIELCKTIRRFKKFQNLPIIMLTAKDGMFDKVKGKFAGSTEYLTKPIDKANLLKTIAKYVGATASV